MMYLKYTKSMEFPCLNLQSQSFILLIKVKMPAFVGILAFMRRINFMLSSVEREESFIILSPGQTLKQLTTLNHLETQLAACLSLKSSKYKVWLQTCVRNLVQEGLYNNY